MTSNFNFKMIFFKIVLLFAIFKTSFQQKQPCTNPNGTPGNCVSIYYCPSLKRTLQKEPFLDTDRSFLVNSKCEKGVGPVPNVCCTNEEFYTNNNIDKNSATSKPLPLPQDEIDKELNKNQDGTKIPQVPQCGGSPLQHRIYNGKDADLGEFPWMAILEYKKRSGEIVPNCAGSLINSRYILTAAHCLTGEDVRKFGTLVSIRLGEHDLTKEIDCDDCGENCETRSCADPVLIVEPDEQILHEGYDEKSINRYNDIALIRLKDHVNFTSFIKPVCLPSVANLERSLPGEEIVVSGWGRTVLAANSNIKQKLQVPVVNQDQCATKFATNNVVIMNSQLCAGAKFYEDSCSGDSGGPLMKRVKLNWAIEGIVSFGHKCGLEGWPGIYTRVSAYEDWIKSKLKP